MFASECLDEGIGGFVGKGAVGVRRSVSGPRGGLGGGERTDFCN